MGSHVPTAKDGYEQAWSQVRIDHLDCCVPAGGGEPYCRQPDCVSAGCTLVRGPVAIGRAPAHAVGWGLDGRIPGQRLSEVSGQYGLTIDNQGTPESADLAMGVFQVQGYPPRQSAPPCQPGPGDPGWPADWASTVAQFDPQVSVFQARLDIMNRLYNGSWTHIGGPAYDTFLVGQMQTAVRVLSAPGGQGGVPDPALLRFGLATRRRSLAGGRPRSGQPTRVILAGSAGPALRPSRGGVGSPTQPGEGCDFGGASRAVLPIYVVPRSELTLVGRSPATSGRAGDRLRTSAPDGSDAPRLAHRPRRIQPANGDLLADAAYRDRRTVTRWLG